MDTSKLNFASLKGKVESKLKESVKEKGEKATSSKDKKPKKDLKKADDNRNHKSNDRDQHQGHNKAKDQNGNRNVSRTFDNSDRHGNNRSFDNKRSFDNNKNNRSYDNKKSFNNSRSYDNNKSSDNRKSFDSRKPYDNKKSFDNRKQFDNTRSYNERKPVPTETLEKLERPAESLSDILRREALALGATEEDLQLLEGVSEGEESEQEFTSSVKLDKEFGNDLNSFMKGIGLGNGDAIIVDDEEVEEVPELVVDEDEEEEEEEEEEDGLESGITEADDFHEEVEADKANDTKVQEKQLDFSKPKETKKELKNDRLESMASVTTDKLSIEPRIDWYNIKVESPISETLTPQQVARLIDLGKEALEEENKIYYEEFSKSSSQKKFLSEILTSGTLNDKISALTLLIQEAPIHNMKAFENLLGMCSKKSRTAALQSINALKDLFVNGLLPDRKLITFTKQSALSNQMDKKQLGLLYYEDFLKKSYFKFIGILEVLSHDPIIHVRMNVVNHLFELLKAKPEQEVNLLKLGVNKLGDIDNKVSAKASYQILQLEQEHPMMKKIIIDAVTDVIFKKNNEYHATYYSILALNQTILTKREDEIANSLIKTYFTLFEKILIESDDKNVSELKTTDYNKTRTKRNFKKGKKGGKSVKQGKTEVEVIEEKNSKLFSAILTGLNRSFPFSSLSNDIFNKHLDTLFKITHSTNFNTSVQALVLIHHITTSQKLTPDRFYRTLYESLLDQRLLTSSKQGIYLNLLFKALKEDKDANRVSSFVKRICQICLNWLNIGTISGMIYLLINLEQSIPSLRNLIITTPTDTTEAEGEVPKQYDPRQRDPRFTNAENSSLWELNQFLDHYHPTVALYAESLLLQKQDVNKPDLGLYTLAHFLDKFVYKNAKQKPATKGSSIMQPLAGTQTGSLLVKTAGDKDDVPVNTRDWLNSKVEEVKPDDLFFYKYFSTKQDKIARSKFDKDINVKLGEYDDEEAGSDLDDEQVWSALVKSNPEVEGADESDYEDFDDELSDFDEADFSEGDSSDDQEVVEAIQGIDEELISDSELEEDAKDKSSDEEGEEEEEEIMAEENAEDDHEENDSDDFEEAELFKGDLDDEFDSEEVELRAIDDDDLSSIDDDDKEINASKKRKASTSQNSKKSKKSKFKDLPTFADADEYAKYLESDEEDF